MWVLWVLSLVLYGMLIFNLSCLFLLRGKISGYFERKNKDSRVRFYDVLKFDLIALDVVNIFCDYNKIQI